MHRIDSEGTVAAPPAQAAVGATVGYFFNGDPGAGQPATVVDQDWLNSVQEEIAAVIAAAGIALDKTVQTQLRDAIAIHAATGMVTIAAADSPYTVTKAAPQVLCNTVAGNITVNFPAVAGWLGKKITVIKIHAANVVTQDGNAAETLNGELTETQENIYTAHTWLATAGGWIQVA